jgi:hypothetical protein
VVEGIKQIVMPDEVHRSVVSSSVCPPSVFWFPLTGSQFLLATVPVHEAHEHVLNDHEIRDTE